MWGWRPVGKFKKKDIMLSTLILDATDLGLLASSATSYVTWRKERVKRAKTKDCDRYFWPSMPVFFINEHKIDFSGKKDMKALKAMKTKDQWLAAYTPLPEVIAWAYLSCDEVVADKPEMYSHLVLIWLQSRKVDPFCLLKEHVKHLNWAAHAKDCSP